MNGLKVLNELRNRAMLLLTLLILVVGVTTTARAQGHAGGGGGGAGKASFQDVHFTASVGVARGQMLRITVATPRSRDQGEDWTVIVVTDHKICAGRLNVFDAVTGAKIKSFEVCSPTPRIRTFDIGGAGDDILFGGENGNRARVQVKVEMTWLVHQDRALNDRGPSFYAPSFEVIDKDSGRTAVQGGLVKAGPGTLLLSNSSNY